MFNWKSVHGLSRAAFGRNDQRPADATPIDWDHDARYNLRDDDFPRPGRGPDEAMPTPGHPAQTAQQRKAALIAAFSPSQPIEDRSQLFGRQHELERIFTAISDLRGHALIHGARGAGKTSLARAFGDYADERGLLVVYLSCDGASNSFADIFRSYLEFLPDSCFGRGQAPAARQAMADLGDEFGPRALASVLARVTEQRTVLIVDEFDRVTDPQLRHDMATLLKLLSDMRSLVHLLFVGIAGDVRELIAGHASVRRHLVAVALRRFGEDDVNALLDAAEARCGLAFEDEARQLLAWFSGGSPYHLRLYAFSAGLAALQLDRATVTPLILTQGLHAAFENWASVNPDSARLFDEAASGDAEGRRRLEILATEALNGRGLTTASLAEALRASGRPPYAAHETEAIAAETIARIRPALAPAPGVEGMVFDDTLAPQFLLLACCFAESRATAPKGTER